MHVVSRRRGKVSKARRKLTARQGTARGSLTVLCNVCGSYEMTPVRVLSRFCVNVATAIIYLAVTMIVGTVTSERPFISAGDLWRSPYAHGAYSRPRSSYLGAAATIVYLAARSLVRTSGMDLFRWGGAASDKLSSKTPTETDPQNPDYTTSISSPRALHAINPMRIAGRRAKQLSSGKRTLPSLKNNQGRALLSQKPAPKVSPSTQICCGRRLTADAHGIVTPTPKISSTPGDATTP